MTPSGKRVCARMQNSVSSQPTGAVADAADAVREPADGVEHLAAEGHVRADQVAHRRGRRRAGRGRCSRRPSRTRPGSSAGRPPPRPGSIAPPTPITARVVVGASAGARASPARPRRRRRGTRRRRRGDRRRPLLRAPDRPRCSALAIATTPSGSRRAQRARAASSLWSTTTMISSGDRGLRAAATRRPPGGRPSARRCRRRRRRRRPWRARRPSGRAPVLRAVW